MKLKKKKFIQYNGKVHDLTVANSSSYNVEGLAVHNSGAGCLISYLTGITGVDPIRFGLFFERFYNVGRNSPGKISLPDIDVDFPVEKREFVIQYMRDKWGSENVCQIATYGRMQGKGAIKEVFRVHNVCSVEKANEITKYIPDENDIADQLEESGETSIIRWVLENDPQILGEYCRLNDNGSLVGEYATYFDQAIRLEGTYRTQGKHAAGVIVASEPIGNIAPMIRDKAGKKICGFSKKDAEDAGLPKMDILGVAALDKLMMFRNLLKTGKMYE